MQSARNLAISALLLLGVTSAGCDGPFGSGTRHPDGVDFSCVLDDQRLSAPLRDPESAQAWLAKAIRAIEEAGYLGTVKDTRTISPETAAMIADLRDLARRARSCLR